MEERKFHVCCDCRARSPETDTNYTLISSRYGWRLTRFVGADGLFVIEWRCPRCWERHKRTKLSTSTPREGVPAASDLRSSSTDLRSSRPGRDVAAASSEPARKPSEPPARRTTRPPTKRR